MFKDLLNYQSIDFYHNHEDILLWDGYTTHTYKIFSVQIVTDNFEHIIVEPNDYKIHLDKLKESIYDTGVEVSPNDDILILQTCSYNPINSFLIVCAKKIS